MFVCVVRCFGDTTPTGTPQVGSGSVFLKRQMDLKMPPVMGHCLVIGGRDIVISIVTEQTEPCRWTPGPKQSTVTVFLNREPSEFEQQARADGWKER